jgi:myo-inositol-1(or 4)-monophosphatase
MQAIDLNEAKNYLFSILPELGTLLNGYFSKKNFSEINKGGSDFKTQADDAADTFLTEHLKEKYPSTAFLTEETAPKDISSFKRIENLWIIDPIDGTTNFSRGNSNFSVSIGLADKGNTKLGIVYLPYDNSIFWAQEGIDGAFHNTSRISVSKVSNKKEVVIGVDWSWTIEKRKIMIDYLSEIYPHVRAIKSMGSAAADLSKVACGQIDLYVNAGLSPWDIAAGSFIAKKAGGKVTKLDGSEWNVFDDNLIASNVLMHDFAVEIARKVLP